MRPTKAIVNLHNLENNIKQLMKLLSPGVSFMPVIKANGYGHGAVEIAKKAIEIGVPWLGVALPEEGARLRQAGIDTPILVLGGIDELQIDTVIENNLSLCLFSCDLAKALNEKCKRYGRQVGVHVKLDTGMGRIGIKDTKECIEVCAKIRQLENLRLEGIFTHFATADQPGNLYTSMQYKRFSETVSVLESKGFGIKWIHAANSAAIMNYPQTHFNLVRAGISMYGYLPSMHSINTKINLIPILQWETRIIHIKRIEKGESVSYGRTYTAESDRTIAILPVGYGDGYPRQLSNKGWVLIKGKRAPIIGTICMDQIIVDITSIPGVVHGDIAVLIGKQHDEVVTADDLAKLCGTISYEILTNISERVPRVYVEK